MGKAARQQRREERKMVERGRSEYGEHLKEQLRWLRRSATAFDDGDESEAKRLATIMRTLLHTHGQSTALLSHMGVRDLWRWRQTPGRGPMRDNYVGSALLVLETGSDHGKVTGRHRAALGDMPPGVSIVVPFDTWWLGPIVRDIHGERFSRWDLIRSLANKDGGAHIDSKREERIIQLAENNSLACHVLTPAGIEAFENNPVLESVRQIAWEVDETITRYRFA